MPQQPQSQLSSNKSRIQLAILAINQGQIQSIRKAAKAYNISHATLTRCLKGIASRSECDPNSKSLTILEEKSSGLCDK
jgi:hypothetical protein